jgi:hypothetical protein
MSLLNAQKNWLVNEFVFIILPKNLQFIPRQYAKEI